MLDKRQNFIKLKMNLFLSLNIVPYGENLFFSETQT